MGEETETAWRESEDRTRIRGPYRLISTNFHLPYTLPPTYSTTYLGTDPGWGRRAEMARSYRNSCNKGKVSLTVGALREPRGTAQISFALPILPTSGKGTLYICDQLEGIDVTLINPDAWDDYRRWQVLAELEGTQNNDDLEQVAMCRYLTVSLTVMTVSQTVTRRA